MHEQKCLVILRSEGCFFHLRAMVMIMSTLFSKYIRYVTTKNDKILISFNVRSLYTNIPISDTLNIMKHYVSNNHEFIRKAFIPQDKHIDLVVLTLTIT